MAEIELTPGLLSMPIIGHGPDAIYLRLPAELQRDCGGCSCPVCKKDPSKAKWDTLAIPLIVGKGYGFSWTVHCPDRSTLPQAKPRPGTGSWKCSNTITSEVKRG